MRARRIAVIAVLAVVGGLALGGCRAHPEVAAYIGDKAFTRAELDAVFRDYKRRPDETPAQALQSLVSYEIVTALAERDAAANGEQLEQPDLNTVAGSLGLKPDSPYVQLEARYQSVVGYLQKKSKPTAPDEPLRRELFRQLQSQGLPPNYTYDQVAQAIDSPQLRAYVGIRNLIGELGRRHDVVVNPRYAPLRLVVPNVEIADGQAQVTVVIPISVDPPAFVRDAAGPPV
jgi:hypothetical protein